MKKKNLSITSLMLILLLPLITLIGLATWFITTSVDSTPTYSFEDVVNYYLKTETSIYSGKEAIKKNNLIDCKIMHKNKSSSEDYTDGAPINAGEYIVKVIDTTSSDIFVEFNHTIQRRDISNGLLILKEYELSYIGTAVEPEIESVTVDIEDNEVLTLTSNDYTISYLNNTNRGIATMTLAGQGNYIGTLSEQFTIVSDLVITLSKTNYEKIYDKEKFIVPVEDITFTSNGESIAIDKSNINYKFQPQTAGIDLIDNFAVNAGSYKVTISVTMEGFKKAETSFNLQINKKMLDIEWNIPSDAVYQGHDYAYTPSASIKEGSVYDGDDVSLQTDILSGYVNAGLYKLSITGLKGNSSSNYDCVKENKTFTINKANLTLETEPKLKEFVGSYQAEIDGANKGTVNGVGNDGTIIGTWSYDTTQYNISGSSETLQATDIELTFIPTSYSQNYNSLVIKVSTTVKAVCYNGSTYYSRIELALSSVSSGVIYCIIDRNPYIRESCTIKSNVELCLPYSGTTSHSYVNDSTSIAYTKTDNRKQFIQIINNSTLTNNGTLTIGAVQNSGGGGKLLNGNATQEYTEIQLLNSSKIINNSTINCYGYISGNNSNDISIINSSTAIVNMPYVIVEHRGGSRFAGMAGKDKSEVESVVNSSVSMSGKTTGEGKPVCYVFNRWYLDGFINVNFKFDYGAKLVGKAALFADGEHNAADMKIISSDGLIKLSNGASLTGFFNTEKQKCSINTFGSWELGSIDVYFAIKKSKWGITAHVKINVSSKNVFLPVPFYFIINLNSYENGNTATVNTSSQSFKLLPGSSLTINEGVTLNAKEIAVYKSESLYPNGTTVEQGDLGSQPYPKKDDAILNCSGKIFATSFGGIVNIISSGSINATNSSVVSKEAHSFTATSIKVLRVVSVDIYIPKYADITLEKNEIKK